MPNLLLLLVFALFSLPVTSPFIRRSGVGRVGLMILLAMEALLSSPRAANAADRSTILAYDSTWVGSPSSKWIALDTVHRQVFTAWPQLDRVDVLSTVDYHLIRSIELASPSSLDISPDGTTVAVGTGGSHVFFFSTSTLAKTNEIVLPVSGGAIGAFVYTANGDAFIFDGSFEYGGTTYLWDHASNTLLSPPSPDPETSLPLYLGASPIARSADYSRIIMGSYGGPVQIVSGIDKKVLWSGSFGTNIDAVAAGKGGNRYAVCSQSYLSVLDSSFDVIYQDERGCLGVTFSPDGQSIYRDVSTPSTVYTQVLDTTTFTARYVPNYFTSNQQVTPEYPTFWQASDATGMVYGLNSIANANGMWWIALDTTASEGPTIPSSDPVRIVRVIDNVGSPQGGDAIRLLCTGVDTASPNATVTIGGKPATNLSITSGVGLPNERIVRRHAVRPARACLSRMLGDGHVRF